MILRWRVSLSIHVGFLAGLASSPVRLRISWLNSTVVSPNHQTLCRLSQVLAHQHCQWCCRRGSQAHQCGPPPSLKWLLIAQTEDSGLLPLPTQPHCPPFPAPGTRDLYVVPEPHACPSRVTGILDQWRAGKCLITSSRGCGPWTLICKVWWFLCCKYSLRCSVPANRVSSLRVTSLSVELVGDAHRCLYPPQCTQCCLAYIRHVMNVLAKEWSGCINRGTGWRPWQWPKDEGGGPG